MKKKTRNEPEVVALCVADLHLSHKPPVARSAEPCWYAAQGRVLSQLRGLAEEYGWPPIICAGDIFDRYNAGPQLVNWAIENLPQVNAVPGQHDLVYHNLDDIKKTSYWTLVEAGVVLNLGGASLEQNGMVLWGFPWGKIIDSPDVLQSSVLNVAVAHAFVWAKGAGYPGAPPSGRLSAYKNKLRGFDAAVFGDNHHGFEGRAGDCNVLNCGCLIRRKIDERGLRPAVGLLRADGTFDRRPLDVSEDRWIDVNDAERMEGGSDGRLEGFLAELEGLDANQLDFRAAVERFMNENDVRREVREVILRAMGESKGS